MIRNYFLIAFRNLRKYKFISFINLFGLSIGLTCCLLILTYIINEISYDKYHKNAENIYRVERTFKNPETGMVNLELCAVAPPYGPLLLNDFKEIKSLTRLLSAGTTAIRFEEKMFNEPDGYFADENLFDVFDVKVTSGNPASSLKEPNSVMLTEDLAKKYFGNADPINKIVRLDNLLNCKVTGIYKNFPGNSHIHPKFLLSFNTLKNPEIYGEERLRTNWGNNSFLTYMLLPQGYDFKKLEAQLPAFQNRHIKDDGGSQFKTSDWSQLNLRKLTDIHLYSHKDDEAEENGDIKRVYIFSAIALFILLIGCINYMNLSTARSVVRAKEIGVRKVVGASKKELILQFLSESVLLTFLATIVALSLTYLALPALNNAINQQLSLGAVFNWKMAAVLVAVPLVVGTLAGLYPALFLSSFQPIKVLKGFLKVGESNISFRKILVVTQFSISIVLIISTAIVFRQLKYMQGKSLGFDKQHIVTMTYSQGLTENFEAFRTALLSDNSIINVGRSTRIPSGRLLDASGSMIRRGDSLAPTKADIKVIRTDENFIPTYGIKMIAGRNFSKNYGADTGAFIINEAAVKILGLQSNEEAIGKQFQYGNVKGELIGVFGDFHFESLHQRILPMVMAFPSSAGGYGRISVKINGNSIPASLAHIENTWKRFLPEIPFEYTFLDENFGKLYLAEQRQGLVFSIFACIAIFIACLGLFGLSAFAISQRVKEIGIRKVLGASISSLVTLLSKDFLKLVGVAAIIAFPVAWYAMNTWLQDFAYKINIPWWVFVAAGVIAALIAFATISFQAIKAAISNPVKNLRIE